MRRTTMAAAAVLLLTLATGCDRMRQNFAESAARDQARDQERAALAKAFGLDPRELDARPGQPIDPPIVGFTPWRIQPSYVPPPDPPYDPYAALNARNLRTMADQLERQTQIMRLRQLE